VRGSIYIDINRRRLYLRPDKLRRGFVAGVGGDSEQCEGCGTDVAERGAVEGTVVRCDVCDARYPVQREPAASRLADLADVE